MKTALITGVSGQGGAYLAKALLERGYEVVGTSRDARMTDTKNLELLGIVDLLILKSLDLQNPESVRSLIDQLRPDEIYHLAAPSSVAMSFREPAETIYSIALTTANVLEAIRKTDRSIPCFIASSTEIFGNCYEPATADTAHNPKSPYGIGKSCAHYQARNYREAYGLFACSGILSNFESPLRPKNYVTAKIVLAACDIALGERDTIELGNLSIRRDWASAYDSMEAAWLSLQQPQPDDYLIATGTTSSLQDFLRLTFSALNLDYRDYLVPKNSLLRPLDIQQTICNPETTNIKLNWTATQSLSHIVIEMLHTELNRRVGVEAAQKMLNISNLDRSMAVRV